MNREQLAKQLTIDEDDVPYAYPDSEGYLTIGIGRLIDKRLGGGLSPDERQYLLKNDIDGVEQDLDAHLPWWRSMSEKRQQVIANMCFNMGIERLLGFVNTLRAMKEGRYQDAAQGMKDSKWYGQVGNRAKRLVKMMLEG